MFLLLILNLWTRFSNFYFHHSFFQAVTVSVANDQTCVEIDAKFSSVKCYPSGVYVALCETHTDAYGCYEGRHFACTEDTILIREFEDSICEQRILSMIFDKIKVIGSISFFFLSKTLFFSAHYDK